MALQEPRLRLGSQANPKSRRRQEMRQPKMLPAKIRSHVASCGRACTACAAHLQRQVGPAQRGSCCHPCKVSRAGKRKGGRCLRSSSSKVRGRTSSRGPRTSCCRATSANKACEQSAPVHRNTAGRIHGTSAKPEQANPVPRQRCAYSAARTATSKRDGRQVACGVQTCSSGSGQGGAREIHRQAEDGARFIGARRGRGATHQAGHARGGSGQTQQGALHHSLSASGNKKARSKYERSVEERKTRRDQAIAKTEERKNHRKST